MLRFQKQVSLTVAIVFTLFSIVTTVPPAAFAEGVSGERPVHIPSSLGSVDKVFHGESESPIIYIQDAHSSLEAQKNIAGIISYLVKENSVDEVLVEGYEGGLPLDALFAFRDADLKQKVSYFFMDYLRLSGAQYAFVNREKDFRITGIENMYDYLANLEAYQAGSKNQKRISEDLKKISKYLTVLGNKIYPKEIKDWLKLKKRFEEKKLSLSDYIFRTMKIYYRGESREPRAESEQYPNLRMVAENLGKKQLTEAEQKELNTKLEAISAREFFNELNRFEADFAEKYLVDEKAETTFRYQQTIDLLSRLNHFSLSSFEFEELQEQLKSFNTDEVVQFIAENLNKSLVFSSRWEDLIQNQIRFYELALKRDQNFINALSRATSDESQATILVTGGFHKDGITGYLEKENISYILVSPAITKKDLLHQQRYDYLMSGQYFDFERPFYLPAFAAQQPTLAVLPEPETAEMVQIAGNSLDFSGTVDPKLIIANYKVAETQKAVAAAKEMEAAGKSLGDIQEKEFKFSSGEISLANKILLNSVAVSYPNNEIKLIFLDEKPEIQMDLKEMNQVTDKWPMKLDSRFKLAVSGDRSKFKTILNSFTHHLTDARLGNQIAKAVEGKSLGKITMTPEEVTGARSVELYRMNRELIALLDEYKEAKGKNNDQTMQLIINRISLYADDLNSNIDEIRSRDDSEQEFLESISGRSPPELKELADDLDKQIRSYTPLFIESHDARDHETLDRLNHEVVPLLKQRLKTQLLRLQQRLSQPSIYSQQGPMYMLLGSCIGLYRRLAYEHSWRARRARGEEKISRIHMGDASGNLVFTLEYEREPVLRIERFGDKFTIIQNVWKYVDVEGGEPVLMAVPTRINFEEEGRFGSLQKAMRSRIKSIASQEEDYKQLIYHDFALEDVSKLLQPYEAETSAPAPVSLKEDVLHSLESVLSGPQGKRGLRNRRAPPKDAKGNVMDIAMPKGSLETAMRLIESGDIKGARGLISSARRWISYRSPNIEGTLKGTTRQKDYIYLLIQDSVTLEALQNLKENLAKETLNPDDLRSSLKELEGVRETFFRFKLPVDSYQRTQKSLKSTIAALKTLIRDAEKTPPGKKVRNLTGMRKNVSDVSLSLENLMVSRLSDEEKIIYKAGRVKEEIEKFQAGYQAGTPLNLMQEKDKELLGRITEAYEISQIELVNSLLKGVKNEPAGYVRAQGLAGKVSKALYNLKRVLEGTKTQGTVETWMSKRSEAPFSLDDIKNDLSLIQLSLENPKLSDKEIEGLQAGSLGLQLDRFVEAAEVAIDLWEGENGRKANFEDRGLIIYDTFVRPNRPELIPEKFAGFTDYMKEKLGAGDISEQEMGSALLGASEWSVKEGYPEKLVAKLEDLNAEGERGWEIMTIGFFRQLPFGTAGKRGTQVDKKDGRVLPGSNYINDYTVAEYTLGLARYLKKIGQDSRGVVLGGDTRIKSVLPYRDEISYTELEAKVLRKMGVKVYRFIAPRAIGQAAWATSHFDAASAEYNSASHNLWHDNGVKALDEFSAQLFANERDGILAEIENIKPEDIADLDLYAFDLEADRLKNPDQYILLGGEDDAERDASIVDADSEYVRFNQGFAVDKNLVADYSGKVNSLYTPVHGVGIHTAVKTLNDGKNFGYNVTVLEAQAAQDEEGRFPTVEKPDPNFQNPVTGARTMDMALEEAANLEKNGIYFDFVWGSDPDFDRTVYVVKDRNQDWKILKANDAWALLVWFKLSQLRRMYQEGRLSDEEKVLFDEDGYLIKTWVTSDLLKEIAEHPQFGLTVFEPAVGFNKIGEVALKEIALPILARRRGVDPEEIQGRKVITLNDLTEALGIDERKAVIDEINEILRGHLVFGAEESNGISPGGHALEKVGDSASILFHEAAAFIKAVNADKEKYAETDPFIKSYFETFGWDSDLTLYELLNRIYLEYGYHATENIPLEFEGLTGLAQKEKALISIGGLAEKGNNYRGTPDAIKIGDKEVDRVAAGSDYTKTDHVEFTEPGYRFTFTDGNWLAARPSGTEAYIRVYGNLKVPSQALNWENIETEKLNADSKVKDLVLAMHELAAFGDEIEGASLGTVFKVRKDAKNIKATTFPVRLSKIALQNPRAKIIITNLDTNKSADAADGKKVLNLGIKPGSQIKVGLRGLNTEEAEEMVIELFSEFADVITGRSLGDEEIEDIKQSIVQTAGYTLLDRASLRGYEREILTAAADELQQRLDRGDVLDPKWSKQNIKTLRKVIREKTHVVIDRADLSVGKITFAILKPEVMGKTRDEIIDFIEESGLEIVWIGEPRKLGRKKTRQFYREHKERDFYNGLTAYMNSAETIPLLIKGKGQAFEALRKVAGKTDGTEPGTLRSIFGTDEQAYEGSTVQRNKIHASDSFESVIRESLLIFNADEIASIFTPPALDFLMVLSSKNPKLDDAEQKEIIEKLKIAKAASLGAAEKSQLEQARDTMREVAADINMDEVLLNKIIEPERVMEVSIPVKMDDGTTRNFQGFRSQHNSALGPYKGGFRMSKVHGVKETRNEAIALSTWMSIKTAAVGLPLGGGKGDIIVDRYSLSKGELARLTRGYIREMLNKYGLDAIGPFKDIPAPDMNTDAEVMAWFLDEYLTIMTENGKVDDKRLEAYLKEFMAGKQEWNAAETAVLDEYMRLIQDESIEGFNFDTIELATITGKPAGKAPADPVDPFFPVDLEEPYRGGSQARDKATGQGGFFALKRVMATNNETVEGKAVAVQGYGNVGGHFSRIAHEAGMKVKSIQSSYRQEDGAWEVFTIRNEDGINIEELDKWIGEETEKRGTPHFSFADFPGAESINNETFWKLDVDVLTPAARDRQITDENAPGIKVRYVLELANGPTTNKADKILNEKGVIVIPDVFANAGGVTVSFLEMIQNKSHDRWTTSKVDRALLERMNAAADEIYDIMSKNRISMREAAYRLALMMIANAEIARDEDLQTRFKDGKIKPYDNYDSARFINTLPLLNSAVETGKILKATEEAVYRFENSMKETVTKISSVFNVGTGRNKAVLIMGPEGVGKAEVAKNLIKELQIRYPRDKVRFIDGDRATEEEFRELLTGNRTSFPLPRDGFEGPKIYKDITIEPGEILVIEGARSFSLVNLMDSKGRAYFGPNDVFPVFVNFATGFSWENGMHLTALDLLYMRDILDRRNRRGERMDGKDALEILKGWHGLKETQNKTVFSQWPKALVTINMYFPAEIAVIRNQLWDLLESAEEAAIREKDEGVPFAEVWIDRIGRFKTMFKNVTPYPLVNTPDNYPPRQWAEDVQVKALSLGKKFSPEQTIRYHLGGMRRSLETLEDRIARRRVQKKSIAGLEKERENLKDQIKRLEDTLKNVYGKSLGEEEEEEELLAGISVDSIEGLMQRYEEMPMIVAFSLDEYKAMSPQVQEEIVTHFVAGRIKLVVTGAEDWSEIPQNLKQELENKRGAVKIISGGLNKAQMERFIETGFSDRGELYLHFSILLDSTKEIEDAAGYLKDKISFFKQQGENPGTLTAAMLLLEENSIYLKFFQEDSEGFWVLSPLYSHLDGIVQDYISAQSLGKAA